MGEIMNIVEQSDRGVRPIQYRNQFDRSPAPFFTIPAWWRRFIFRVLSARELVVYVYLCSLTDRNALAFPTHLQIANEVGLTGSDAVARALKKLVDLGFFTRNMQIIKNLRRGVYQRPLTEYTLLRLLDARKIDFELLPANKEHESINDPFDTTESAVALGLKNLLGTERFSSCMKARSISSALASETLYRELSEIFWLHTGMTYEESNSLLNQATNDF